jgi:hypothetical protein
MRAIAPASLIFLDFDRPDSKFTNYEAPNYVIFCVFAFYLLSTVGV